jgi:hypothetical protein
MKHLALSFILITRLATAQCPSTLGSTFEQLPSFIGLFFSGNCISGTIRDTTICVEYAGSNRVRAAYFSFSTPNGSPVNVTQINQYNPECELIAQGNEILPSSEPVIVCYTLTANFVDNFCPYAIFLNPLSVDWCGFEVSESHGRVNVQWATCSNSNTNRFEILVSKDLELWQVVRTVQPYSVYSNQLDVYKVSFMYSSPGNSYVMIREIGNDGRIMQTDERVFFQPYVQGGASFDILGRQTNGENKQWHWIRNY